MSTLQVAARGAAMPAAPRRRLLGRDWRLGFALIAPVFVVIVGLVAYPLGYSVWLSLQDVKVGAPGTFVGLNNYYKILFDSDARIHHSFWSSLKITALYVVGACVGKFIVGMISALILNANIRARHFWRSLLFLPWAIPGVVAAYNWKFIYNDVNGVANGVLTNVGLIDAPILFLAKPENALWSILVGVIWQGAPFWTMTFLAGLQSIPSELYEAAEIDGAGIWRRLWSVTIPMLSPVIFFNLIMAIIGTLQVFTIPYIMTSGGPARSTYFYTMYLYDNAFNFLRMGYASAMAWIQLLIILILTAIAFWSGKRWVYYQGR
jgi:multiple sugar transport system permease protein